MNPWLTAQEIIGPKESWPYFIRNYLWCSTLGYKERVVLASFFYQNGLSPELMIETVQFCNKHCTNVKLNKLIGLYEYWDHPELGFLRRQNYFALDLIVGKVLNLNGRDRTSPLDSVSRGYPSPGEKHYQC